MTRMRTYYGLLIMTMLLVMQCSPRNGQSFLQYFFDGVPEKGHQANAETEAAKQPADPLQTGNNNITAVPAFGNDSLFYHKPFKEKECNTCHSNESPGSLSHGQNKICYSCHQNYAEKSVRVHGPVAAGECTTCHEPHAAPNKKLLRREGQELCLYCHESGLVMKNKAHFGMGQKECTDCHEPHGGKDRFMIK